MTRPVSDAEGAAAGAAADALTPGQAAFYDSVVPALPIGEYQIIVQDTVEVDQQPQAPYAAVQRFRVAGPRVALAPGDVVAMSPPSGSQGSYDTWLPHVVLAQRSLPWQVPITDPAAGGAATGPAVPWLALLLFTSQEIDVAGAPPAAATTGAQTVPLASYLSPPSGTLGPNPTTGLQTFQQEQPDVTCAVVDVTFDAFRAVTPTTAELPFLAHVRQVDTSDQETLGVPAPGWYSVVAGNRLPVGAPDNLYIAHLVSLEGFAGYLPDQPAPSGYSLVRLLSLASWSFTSGPGAGNFASLVQGLCVGPLTVPVTVGTSDAASQLVSTALTNGYTMLSYTSRLGEPTIAWYRGPLQPAPVPANPQPAYQAASAALIYDPTTGIFDASYAAAWEIGRLLTLANGPVAISLSQWTASATSAIRQLLAEQTAAAEPGQAPGSGAPTPATSTPRMAARQRAATALVATQVVPALLGRDGARPALGPPGDPTGLRDVPLPGLLGTETLRQLHADGDIYQQVHDQAVAAARGGAPASPASGGPPTQKEAH
jgi:hypothetical protein